MGDDITIGVTEIVNNIEVTAQPNDQIVDISVIDNADDVTLNITPTVIEINVNRGSSFAKWGTILGTLSDQTDLQNALNLKANLVGGKVPASELPSYVDDVVEVANYAALPATGETGKIYVTLDNNKIYRWSGSVYIEIAANSAIWGAITGTLSSQTDLQTALDAKQDDLVSGTNIKTIEGQSLLGSGNIDLTKSDVGLSNVDNTSDANKPISTATQTALDAKQNTITLTTTGASGSSTLVGSTLNIPNYTTDISGLVPYTGATANVNLGTHKLTASDLVINHASGSGVAASITKGGSGEALTVLKTSGSGNAASILGGVTLLDELHLNTDLADSYIASAATWNAKQSALTFSSPLVNTSGTISIPAASGSVNGYLSSADWTTFNNKVESVAASLPLGSTGGKAPVISITQATTSSNGYLSSTDWNTFNGKQNALTNPITGTGTTNYLPKFTGSTALGNSLIYDNGTNVGIGTTSPNSKLHVNGALTLDNNSIVRNAGNNILNFGADADMYGGTNSDGGIFVYGANKLHLSTNSARRLTVNSSGNVGIGTTSPTRTLEVVGTMISQKESFSPSEFLIGQFDSAGNAILNNVANAMLAFNTNNTRRMTITSGGNVGIGTTSPSARLSVANAVSTTATVMSVGTSNNGLNFIINSNGAPEIASAAAVAPIHFSQGSTRVMTLSDNGNVGIGTTSPNQLLHIEKDQNTYTNLRIRNNDTGSSAYTMIGLNSSGNSWGMRMGSANANSNRLDFVIDAFGTPVERMSITSGGRVGIGFTSPVAKLSVRGEDNTSSNFSLEAANGSGASLFYVRNDGATFVANLGTGLVYSSGGALTSTNPSDSRLKDNIVSLNYGLNEILKLRPVSYNWKYDKINQGKQFGFIAQEVQKVMPELVKEFETEEGNRLGLDKEGIYAALVNAIKEQNEVLAQLKAEIEILKTK